MQNFWEAIVDWANGVAANIDEILAVVIRIAIVIILSLAVIWIIRRLLRAFLLKKGGTLSRKGKKAETLYTLFSSLTKYAVLFIAVAIILGELGLGATAGSLFATAGIGGLAIGIGAQNLIKDIVAGFFLLFEEQYSVGDYISITSGNITGTVEAITIRTTHIRGYTGELHIIPNGTIDRVTNYMRGNMLAVVDVGILRMEDVAAAHDALVAAGSAFAAGSENVVAPPEVPGIIDINETGITMRLVCRVKPLTHWAAEREMRRLVLEEFAKRGIESVQLRRYIVEPGGRSKDAGN